MIAAADIMNDPSGKLSVEKLVGGDRPTLARAISMIERDPASANALLSRLHGRTGRAWRVGVTGPPGAGKSTLAAGLAGLLSGSGHSVAIIAVDPTSPYTGGAVLGDRVRMAHIDTGDRVFIRSMATRGRGGGLSAATMDAADLLDAAGFDYIVVESTGVGQVELDIRQAVDTALVVLMPESGDEVQAIKAGLMEIADVYVMNKCDRPGSGAAFNALRTSLEYRLRRDEGWVPRVLQAVGTDSEGVPEIRSAMEHHRRFLVDNDLLGARRAEGARTRLRRLVERTLTGRLWDRDRSAFVDEMADRVIAGETGIRDVVDEVLRRFHRDFPGGSEAS